MGVSATATAVSGLSITGVQFKLDNVNLAQAVAVNGNVYSITLDATGLSSGPHALAAVGTDSAGNSTTRRRWGLRSTTA